MHSTKNYAFFSRKLFLSTSLINHIYLFSSQLHVKWIQPGTCKVNSTKGSFWNSQFTICLCLQLSLAKWRVICRLQSDHVRHYKDKGKPLNINTVWGKWHSALKTNIVHGVFINVFMITSNQLAQLAWTCRDIPHICS